MEEVFSGGMGSILWGWGKYSLGVGEVFSGGGGSILWGWEKYSLGVGEVFSGGGRSILWGWGKYSLGVGEVFSGGGGSILWGKGSILWVGGGLQILTSVIWPGDCLDKLISGFETSPLLLSLTTAFSIAFTSNVS
jgi:hypothetical protein